jgi:peptidoglycan hydrolase CwlO-like protein
MSTIKISQLGNLTAFSATTIIPVVANVAGTLTTVKGNTAQLSSFILGNLTTADLANISANVTTLQSNILTLTANAGTQAGSISTLTANAGAQSALIDSLDSNVGAQLGLIYTLQDDVANLTANVGTQADTITTLTANAGAQADSINVLLDTVNVQANLIVGIQSNITILGSNVDVNTAMLANVESNVTSIQGSIESINEDLGDIFSSLDTLTANSASQQQQIDSLGAIDLEALESNISALFSAVGVHTGEIFELQTNAAFQASAISTLEANAATQAGQILALGNTSAISANISILQSNVATLQSNVSTLQSNVLVIQGNISNLSGNVSSLTANAGAQSGNISALEANVSVLQSNIAALQNGNVEMRGYVDSAISANIAALIDSAPETLNTLNEIAAALGDDANLSVTLTNSIANVAANVSTLFANAGVQSGNITVLQSAVGSLTANAVSQQNNISVLQGNITSITNGTATFGNLIPSANVTYDLGSEAAQWRDLYLSGNTINLGGSTISQAGGAIVFSAAPGVDIGLRNVTGWQDYANNVDIAIGQPYTIDSTMGTWGDLSNPGPGPYLDGAVPGIRYAFGNEPANPAQWTFTYDVNGFVDTITLVSVGDPIQFDDQFEFVWFPDPLATVTPVFLGEASTDPIDTTDTIWNADGKELYINRDASTNIVSVTGTGWTGADIIPGGLDGRFAVLKLPDDSVVFDGIDGPSIGVVEDCFALSFFIVTTETSYAPVATSTSTPSYDSVTANTGTITGNLTIGGNLTVTNDIGFIMANYQHWTSNVSTISDALNQLAERIWNIENP